MARVLPDPLVGSFAPEVLRISRALKAISGDDFIVWVSLPLPGAELRPEFLVVHGGTTAFVVGVCSAGDSDIEEALHGGLFVASSAAKTVTEPGSPQRQRVHDFIAAALGDDAAAHSGPPAVYGLLLFPNASHELLRQLWPENPHCGCHWLGEKFCAPEALASCLRRLAKGGLAERHLAQLRSQFAPETVVPARFSPRARPVRNLDATLTPLLLDYDQEAWAKNRLLLSGEARAVAETQGAYGEAALVTGVAGSGKSLVLLFRACNQARLAPETRSLVLTHNKALRHELEARFGELGRPTNVDWHTYFSWVQEGLDDLRGAESSTRIVQYGERDRIIAETMRAMGLVVTGQKCEFLRDEFDWMQDRAVTDRGEYLLVERTGRGVRLTAEQREEVHAVYRGYCARLAALRAEDWSGRALRHWRGVESGAIIHECYDFIYVDEAQFFAPVWLRALRKALRPGTGRLLLAADPTQGFLKRRQSWVACGLDLRGRSTRLRRSYRNTRAILEFALLFYRERLGDDLESDINLPEAAELESAEPGTRPVVVPLGARQDELERVVREVCACLRDGATPETVLVLVALGHKTQTVVSALAARLGVGLVTDARAADWAGRVRVCGIDGATGLEAPIVFVVGASELMEREADLQLPEEQRAELRRDNTRRLYMAFTRAGQRLVITWVGRLPKYWELGPSSSISCD
jgi:hypothetical protein